ncbi:hypothetical protein E6W36_13810 [Hankyongella ginsenosidimutans]|uniref:Flagellin n=1 Tax=Hankyongella ginsenosidimutans TaxID=1763828 RepID=A0A4D7BXT6_9SPHN|nr:flagellin [Hankyongella ginsenosidimutans]QCI80189.1 hypothetical protein E6W36_13810 [Hankyongella ginsenosidimutans]
MAFSVNTNTGAFVALQNLSTTNRSLAEVQNRVNTGLRVSSAKDDSSSYSIAQGLRGDVAGLSAVQTSLNRAKSSLDVAVQAGESISDLLNRAREIAVAASDSGLDTSSRTALNNDFKSIISQVDSVVSQAEFNGTNLIKASPDSISAITAVKQNSTVDRISLSGVDLTTGGSKATTVKAAGAITVAASTSLADLVGAGGVDGAAIATELDGLANVTLNDDGTLTAVTGATSGAAAGGVTFTTGSTTLSITVGGKQFDATLPANGAASTTYSSLKLSDFKSTTGTTVTTTGGGFSRTIKSLDLTKQVDRASAAAVVDNFKANVNATLATFGSTSRQIDIQQQFATKLTDSINSGIGNLVDADLAKESARLQALQVKQQLGLQALSIANQAPQSVVSLFR